MTQARVRFSNFEEYLSYSDKTPLEGRYLLIDGELVELPPESEPNNWIANHLQFLLVAAKVAPLRLIKIHSLELQVPVLHPGDAANRYPDLVVLREEHLAMTQRRLTITLDMPPPRLIAEVISPGKSNRELDVIRKRNQYAVVGVSEYWLIEPKAQTIQVLTLQGKAYEEVGVFGRGDAIASREFPRLVLTTDQIFEADL